MPHQGSVAAPPAHSGASASEIGSFSIVSRASTTRPHMYVRRADLDASIAAYERLLTAIKSYTTATLAMSQASSELAGALEECSHIKGAHNCGDELQAAGGLHYLKSNNEQLLCDTFWKEVSIPLLSNLDMYKANVHERQMVHERIVTEKSSSIKDIEKKNQREGRRRERDLTSYRKMLNELQAHVDELEELKHQHYHEVLECEEHAWEYISSKIALLVSTQSEICARIANKVSVDPVLDSMTSDYPDPFNTYGPQQREDELFTVLPHPSVTSTASNANDSGSGEATMHATSADLVQCERQSSQDTNKIFSESGDEIDFARSLTASTSYSSLFGKSRSWGLSPHNALVKESAEECVGNE